MSVGGKFVHALELERARRKPLALERLGLDRGDLAGEETRSLRRDRAGEAARGVSIDLGPRDLVGAREVLRGISHADVGGGITQRFPEEILEVDSSHAEASTHGVGGDRVAAHGLRADAKREPDLFVGDDVRRLDQHFDPGAAHPLHHVRRHLDRHPGIEPDVARQTVGVKARLRHRAGDDSAHILRRYARTGERLARRLDAQIRRRDLRQCPVVVGERGAHPAEEPHVAPARA